MLSNNDSEDESNRGRSRRSFAKRTALVAAGLTFGSSDRGSALAQDDGDTQSGPRARMYVHDFYPGARFRVVSDALEYKPAVEVQEGEAFLEAQYWSDYGTRIVRYENTGERVLFFPPLNAGVEKGDVYHLGEIRSTETLAEGVLAVGIDRVETGERG